MFCKIIRCGALGQGDTQRTRIGALLEWTKRSFQWQISRMRGIAGNHLPDEMVIILVTPHQAISLRHNESAIVDAWLQRYSARETSNSIVPSSLATRDARRNHLKLKVIWKSVPRQIRPRTGLLIIFGDAKKMRRLGQVQFSGVGIDAACVLKCDLGKAAMIDC